MTDKKKPTTPSEFYRNRRPENFSDSEKMYEVQLTREHFAFELSKISTNQKQDSFETFCRRLAEELIAPNLIPQVGPTGGGDGKTDSETHPVSESISSRWFVRENGWNKDENWAFAISAKEDWLSKVKGDVKKIVGTGRGYTKVYFMSNQLISSKKKKDAQDELKKTYGVEVTILDGEWITEKIYTNNLIPLAVDSLNLSSVYKNEKVKLGANDTARLEALQELEDKIGDTNRYFEYDYQLVEDGLQSAIYTRMLEKPRDEVVGKFDRVLRFAQKVNNSQQLSRVYYQRAWTWVNWYDDYEMFATDFKEFAKYATDNPNVDTLESYSTLINLARTVARHLNKPELLDFKIEETAYTAVLDSCLENTARPATALTARMYKAINTLMNSFTDEKVVAGILQELAECFAQSATLLEFPFEAGKDLVEVLGDLLPDNRDFDRLVDCVAEVSEKRTSQLVAGQMFIKRGYQKLSKGLYKESLIYFGKSVMKVAKAESTDYLYFALIGLHNAYRNIGLLWAANNSILAASSIVLKEFHNEGRLNARLLTCLDDALKNELFLGRLPYLLSWHELYKVVRLHFQMQEVQEEQSLPMLDMVDACMGTRLLNTPYEQWKTLTSLPDILEKQELWLAQDATLYILGYPEKVETYIAERSEGKTIDEHYNMYANQPFKDQMAYATNYLHTDSIEFTGSILGTSFIVQFKADKDLAVLAEILLAYFESFLATAFTEVYPSTESITIRLIKDNTAIAYSIGDDNSTKTYTITAPIFNDAKQEQDALHAFMLDIIVKILPTNFIMKEAKDFLYKLYEQDEVHERVSVILSHRVFLENVFGKNPKIFLSDWKGTSTAEYPFVRTANPIIIAEPVEKNDQKSKQELGTVKHSDTKVVSIIDNHLWDQAHWKGFGYFQGGGIPLGMFIAYEQGQPGKQIFQDWIKKYGNVDKDEVIRVAIIKGISKEHPYWYRVHISKELDEVRKLGGQTFISASRIHEMNPDTPTNLRNLIDEYNKYKQFGLFPATFNAGGIEPFIECGILKTKLVIRDAWEVGQHDIDSVVIRPDDDPMIPEGVTDAPVLETLKWRKAMKE